MNDPRPEAIRQSWADNAAAWTAAVRGGRIESRRRVTNRAMLDAVTALAPARVLDVGCGAGWLCRALERRGVAAVGVEGSAPLVEAARRAGAGQYHCVTYTGLAFRGDLGLFDVAVLAPAGKTLTIPVSCAEAGRAGTTPRRSSARAGGPGTGAFPCAGKARHPLPLTLLL